MTALTANTARVRRHIERIDQRRWPGATGGAMYEGSLLCFVESSGRVQAATAAAGVVFIGVSATNVTGNTGGSVYVLAERGFFEEKITGSTALTKGYTMCQVAVQDDDSVDTCSGAGTAGVQVKVGRMVEWVSANTVWVEMSGVLDKTSP